VVHDFLLPQLQLKLRIYRIVALRTAVAGVIPDPKRREEIVRGILREAGFLDEAGEPVL